MSENLPAIKIEMAVNFNDPKIIQALKATVAKDLTEPEFVLFAQHCKGTGLNPFKKEVWAIKAGGRLQIMTGINGFLAIANAHPEFDGMEVDVDNDDKPTKATCRVYRKDRKFPAIGVALMSEYKKDTPIWKQMPRVMLTKVAKSIALREAFPQELNGMYTDDEMPPQFAVPEAHVTKSENGNSEPTKAAKATNAQEYEDNLRAKVEANKANPPAELDPDVFLTFGKHKGKRWDEVNPDYLGWLSEQNGKHSQKAIFELNRRQDATPPLSEEFKQDALPWDRDED